ncbi:MAG: selenocysteine lyase [Bacteroidetes bacterium 43-93]|nr:aminotransferase class V-fold PLP-dependent enzyme [Bacteroidota bacterium]OJW96819.1 MAG: selenocysteine lyase [Bacteroidetes bacterium 43-93]
MQHFEDIRKNIIGIDHYFVSPFGKKKILYADWTASGRMYKPIEDYMMAEVYPYVANTHTRTTYTGTHMTELYQNSLKKIKQHVCAGDDEAIISSNAGMTGVINKFQRLLGLKLHENFSDKISIPENERPIVFITHMEHHSNHTTWLETICDVEIISPNDAGEVDLEYFETLVQRYAYRKTKIASVTACSNVTGVYTPYKKIAAIIHKHGGYCFVDFACSAPYTEINMNPAEKDEYLDAIFFSPHKFLGGPGSAGILVFKKKLYHNVTPDHPGGGTVVWTSPYEKHVYKADIESREDGGTPGFIQTIRVAKAIELKEEMGVANIQQREEELLERLWARVEKLDGVKILEPGIRHRQAILSLVFEDIHYHMVVKALNDMFGIQTRGGCSCAGTYGHHLYGLDHDASIHIKDEIVGGNPLVRIGWVRVSLHPTMLDAEIDYIADAIEFVAGNKVLLKKLYQYDKVKKEFYLDENALQQETIPAFIINTSLAEA